MAPVADDVPTAEEQRATCRLLYLAAILALGLLVRTATISSPLFDFHSWRQADSAAIARNFVQERFNPLYPQVDFRGSRPVGYVETGFELHAFIVATLSLPFGWSTETGRVVSALSFLPAALLLASFVRRRYGESASLIALFLYALGLPLTVFMDRAFMNEALLTMLSIGCLWTAQSYVGRQRPRDLGALLLASTLIAIVKPTYLIVWGPIAGLFIERFGRRVLLRWELWMLAAVNLASCALWFAHAHRLYELTGLTFGLSDKLLSASLLFSTEYWVKIATRLLKDIIGPVGMVFGPVGLYAAVRSGRVAEALGVLGFAFYLVVVTIGNFHHNYYQLPIVPVATVLASLGIVEAVRRLAERRSWAWATRMYVYAAILGAAVMTTYLRSVSAHNWYEVNQGALRICEEVSPLLRPDDRVVFLDYPSPDILFCLDRKGWLLTPHEATPDVITDAVEEGASILITPQASARFGTDLAPPAQPLVSTPEFVAFRLRDPPVSGRR